MTRVCPIAKLEKLLLSTDCSEFNEGAVREAINLSKRCGSKLFAISVVEVNPEFEALAPEIVEKLEKETREHLESVKERASKEGVKCEIIARRGEEPFQYIVDEASKKKADMIVVGRRGKTGLQRLMMGSETARVIGYAPCNILVVPRAAKVECKHILVATDGSRYSEAAVSEAICIAKRCGVSLIAVSVAPSESESPLAIVHTEMQKGLISDMELKAAEENIKRVKEAAEKEGVAVKGLILTGRPYEAIIHTAKERNADLIVVGNYGRTGLGRLLMGSVTERVIGYAECAVLVVKTT